MREFILNYIIIIFTWLCVWSLCNFVKNTVAVLQSTTIRLTKQHAYVNGLSIVSYGSSVCITNSLKTEIFGCGMINTVVISAQK